jgi:hypothetical protein
MVVHSQNQSPLTTHSYNKKEPPFMLWSTREREKESSIYLARSLGGGVRKEKQKSTPKPHTLHKYTWRWQKKKNAEMKNGGNLLCKKAAKLKKEELKGGRNKVSEECDNLIISARNS